MTGYLLDTSVVSALAPDKPPAPAAFLDWVRRRSDALFLPTIAAAEIQQGMSRLRRAGGTVRAERLSVWLDGLASTFGDRLVPIDIRVARKADEIADASAANGRHPGLADVLIAASADVHGMTILTRNMRHFLSLEKRCFDPFVTLPD